MLTVNYKVICINPECKNYDEVFNEFEQPFDDEETQTAWEESYGHGGEDETDYCPTCKLLGQFIED